MKTENQFWFLEAVGRTGLQYDIMKKTWMPYEDYDGFIYPGTFPCSSCRAAKRHLRKHTEIPRGTKFRLVSQYVGRDRILVK